ncbi:unnamed protein product [Hanseniaspora opuntiae]
MYLQENNKKSNLKKALAYMSMLSLTSAKTLSLPLQIVQGNANISAVSSSVTKRNYVLPDNIYQAFSLMSYEIGGESVSSIVDTGSSILWLGNSTSSDTSMQYLCENSACVNIRAMSPAATDMDYSYPITYAQGVTVKPEFYESTLAIAGVDVTDFNFGVVDTYPEFNRSVFGLRNMDGYDSKANLISSLKTQGYISSESFSMTYDGPITLKGGTNPVLAEGEIVFGGYNSDDSSSEMKTFTIDANTQFTALTSVSLKKSSSSSSSVANVTVSGDTVLDSGTTTALIIPGLSTIINSIDATDGIWTCADYEDYVVQLEFGSEILEIPLNNMAGKYGDDCYMFFSDGDVGVNIIGQFVMTNIVSYWDYDSSVVGIMPLNEYATWVSSTSSSASSSTVASSTSVSTSTKATSSSSAVTSTTVTPSSSVATSSEITSSSSVASSSTVASSTSVSTSTKATSSSSVATSSEITSSSSAVTSTESTSSSSVATSSVTSSTASPVIAPIYSNTTVSTSSETLTSASSTTELTVSSSSSVSSTDAATSTSEVTSTSEATSTSEVTSSPEATTTSEATSTATVTTTSEAASSTAVTSTSTAAAATNSATSSSNSPIGDIAFLPNSIVDGLAKFAFMIDSKSFDTIVVIAKAAEDFILDLDNIFAGTSNDRITPSDNFSNSKEAYMIYNNYDRDTFQFVLHENAQKSGVTSASQQFDIYVPVNSLKRDTAYMKISILASTNANESSILSTSVVSALETPSSADVSTSSNSTVATSSTVSSTVAASTDLSGSSTNTASESSATGKMLTATLEVVASSAATGLGAVSVSTDYQSSNITTVITKTSCSDNKCSKVVSTALESIATATIDGVVTEYTTYCPLSSVAKTTTMEAVQLTTSAPQVVTVSSTQANSTASVSSLYEGGAAQNVGSLAVLGLVGFLFV